MTVPKAIASTQSMHRKASFTKRSRPDRAESRLYGARGRCEPGIRTEKGRADRLRQAGRCHKAFSREYGTGTQRIAAQGQLSQLQSLLPQSGGQASEPQPFPSQLVMHPQDAAQLTEPHVCVAQPMSHWPGPHITESQAPCAVQSMSQLPALHSMVEHALFWLQRIVQLLPAHSIPPRQASWFVHSISHSEACVQSMRPAQAV